MKLTKENISLLDLMLVKRYGVIFRDIRLELLDHLATELEQMEGNFDEVFPDFIKCKKNFIGKMNLQLNRQSSKNGVRQLVNSIFSLKFMFAYTIITIVTSYLVFQNGKEWFLEYFEFIPIIISAPISLVEFYTLISSKRNSYTISFVGITNFILLIYLFFIPFIRKADDFYLTAIFSFFMTLSVTYYYFYFVSVKQLMTKIKSLNNKIVP